MGIMYYCPYPECGHFGIAITNVHCKQNHNMSKKEVFEQYGEPNLVSYDGKAYNKNRAIKTIYSDNTPTINSKR